MPYFIITLGNGYQYQLWANSQSESVQRARAIRPSGVAIGATDLLQATANSVGETPQQGVPDANRNYPGSQGFTQPEGGGGTGTTGTTDAPPDVVGDLEASDPAAAHRAGLRQRGWNPEGPLGGMLRDQFAPAYANYSLKQNLAGSPTGASFKDYVAGAGPNAYGDALDLYKNINIGAGLAMPSLRDSLYNAGAGDTEEQQGFRQNFLNVGDAAKERRYSPIGARFAPSKTTLNRQFDDLLFAQGQRGQGAQGISFIDFLRKQYGF